MSRIRRDGAQPAVALEALGLPVTDAAFAPSSRAVRGGEPWLDALPMPVATIALDRGRPRLAACNRAFARLLRVTGRGPLKMLRDAALAGLAAPGAAGSFWTEPGPGGRHFQVHVLPVSGGRDAILTLIDRTAAIETERSLRFEMLHDSLTGLPNRLAFVEEVDAALEAGEGARVAVIALDLVRFSRINESIGALAGDELIITVARRLLAALPAGAFLARTSGDEFSVLVRIVEGPGDMLHAARRIQSALVPPLRLAEVELRVDCALGCALSYDAAASGKDLMRNAHFALKRAKRSRRIEVYQHDAAYLARRQFSLETELRRALDRDELSLAFQPLVDLADGRVRGFEALARWDHADRGEIVPAEFIPVAEESGLIVPLGRWALDRAVQTLAGWDAALGGAQDCYVSVNVSPVQLQCDSVADAVAGVLEAHQIAGSRLTLELTESSIIDNPDRAALVLGQLQKLSCRLAMDDFGTGYSNLAYLQRLPIDVLKIDRKFVTDMLDDRDATAIVRAILGLASALGMATIAEGVENQEVARMLAALGCSTGQGFHFARPLSSQAALEFLRANARSRTS